MTTPVPSTVRGTGPSLIKLVSHFPEARRWRRQADALIVISRQFELMAQEYGSDTHVSLGTLRFSLFHLHQGRIAQLASVCQSVTVYGEADVEPPVIPNVAFVAVPSGAPLSQEWFFIVDSPVFWVAMVTQAIAERANGAMRRYQFEGVLTADERVVSRANLLLSLARKQAVPEVTSRDAIANGARWARIAYALATHPEAQRLGLIDCLADAPELQALLKVPAHTPIGPLALDALRRYCGSVGEVLYRNTGGLLVPVAWSADREPPPARMANEGFVGQAFTQRHLRFHALTPADPEHRLLGNAGSAMAVPISAGGEPWGVVLIGLPEPDPRQAPGIARAVGLATLLEQLIEMEVPDPASNGVPRPESLSALMDQTASRTADITAELLRSRDAVSVAPAEPSATPGLQDRSPSVTSDPGMPGGLSNAVFRAPGAVTAASGVGGLNGNVQQSPGAAPTGPNFGLPPWLAMGGTPTGQGAAPTSAATPVPVSSSPSPTRPGTAVNGFPALQKRLMGALIAFDQPGAEQIWKEAAALYPAESLCTELLMPVQVAIGEGWHRGEVSVAAEHFASRFVESKLQHLFDAHLDQPNAPLAVIGCAQGELHELGALTIALFLKWNGFRVTYLGQNVPNSTIESVVRQLRPQILGLSATTVESAYHLIETGQILGRIEPPRPMFVFGGMGFYERPDLRTRVQGGQFLEGDPRTIARRLATQFFKS